MFFRGYFWSLPNYLSDLWVLTRLQWHCTQIGIPASNGYRPQFAFCYLELDTSRRCGGHGDETTRSISLLFRALYSSNFRKSRKAAWWNVCIAARVKIFRFSQGIYLLLSYITISLLLSTFVHSQSSGFIFLCSPTAPHPNRLTNLPLRSVGWRCLIANDTTKRMDI
jgi:hypothetical protein